MSQSDCRLTSRYLRCRHLWHDCCHVKLSSGLLLGKKWNNTLLGWFSRPLWWGCTSVIRAFFPLFLFQLHSLHSSDCYSLWPKRGERRGQDAPPGSLRVLVLKLILKSCWLRIKRCFAVCLPLWKFCVDKFWQRSRNWREKEVYWNFSRPFKVSKCNKYFPSASRPFLSQISDPFWQLWAGYWCDNG